MACGEPFTSIEELAVVGSYNKKAGLRSAIRRQLREQILAHLREQLHTAIDRVT